ncbi:MAG: type II toxin-antitoxin system HipA family toxin [Verrucomicrobia bacterium]|nr:type II toxin-antitoxin system HipA family toxin [Verrucomicrobiota bacterium]
MNRKIAIHIGDAAKKVGALFFNASGSRESSGIEYASEWLDGAESFSIDPNLPLNHGRFFHTKRDGGSVFFGAIADSEPDGWARQVIMRDHAKQRENSGHFTSLDYLLAVDDFSRVGALRFQDEDGIFQRTSKKGKRTAPPLLELSDLFLASKRIETHSETAADLEYLRGRGTSLAGLRPKCTIMDDDGSLSIGKFPSVGDLYSVTKGEVLALHIAARAGIDAAEARIVDSDGIPVALIKRFDRTKNHGRIPYVSAATLLGIEDSYETHTYTEVIDALRRYSADFQKDSEELFRRIALTILITNVDDHLRNHGFLHVHKNLWRLSPAFDINPFPYKRRTLKTWIAEDVGDVASIQALVDHAAYFGIEFKRVREILSEVESAVGNWRTIGKSLGITAADIIAFAPAFEHEERVAVQRFIA